MFLTISKFSVGEYYTVAVDDTILKSVEDEFVDAAFNSLMFEGRRTKIDSLIKTRPKLYTIQHRTILRSILNAVGREDDLIGGVKEEGNDIIRG